MPSVVTLELLSLDMAPLDAPRECVFEGNGGSIGRDPGNHLVLADVHRRISRLHATVTFVQGVATLTNASSSLPVLLGAQQLAPGQSAPLLPGQKLEIGPYVLRVKEAAASPAAPNVGTPPDLPLPLEPALPRLAPVSAPMPDEPTLSSPPPRAAPPEVAPPDALPADPFAAFLSGMQVASPAAPVAMPGPREPFMDPVPSAFGGAGAARSAMQIPEDFNPFGSPSDAGSRADDPLAQLAHGAGAQAPWSALPAAGSDLDSLLGPSVGHSLDGLQPAANANGLDADLLGLKPETAEADPLRMFGISAFGAGAPSSPARDDLAEINSAFAPPPVLRPQAAAPMVQMPSSAQASVSARAESHASQDALTHAFLSGLGLPASALPAGLTPDLMHLVGRLLRSATAGAVDMLAARAATKRELQASVTIISSQANNPLKFAPSAEVALQVLLNRPMPGFMSADAAMTDAFNDLRAHEMAVIAGMRAALADVLARFDPQRLGTTLERDRMVADLIPALRKNRLWESFVRQYAVIRDEAEGDFQTVFGKAFLQAYERESAQVKTLTSTEPGLP